MATQFDISVLFKLIDKLSGPMAGMQNKLTRASKKLNAVGDSFIKTGMGLSTKVTLPIVGLGIAAVASAAKFEQYQVAFETMLGSGDKAKKMLQDLKTFSAKTPLQLSDLAQGAQTMLAFGISAEKILPNLKMVGDVSLGNKEKMKSLNLAFSQVQSQGKLMGIQLLMMIRAGFNPLTVIAEKTGLSMSHLKEAMAAGAISSDMVTQAFKDATSEGGRFHNALQAQSKTTSGLISTLKDNVELMAAAFGDILLPLVNKAVLWITKFAQKIKNLSTEKKKLIIKILAFAAAIGPIIIGLGILFKIGGMLIMVLKVIIFVLTLLASHPIILVIIAIVAAVVGLIWVIKNWGKVTKWLGKIWDKVWKGIKTGFKSFIDFFKEGWDFISKLFDNPIFATLATIFLPMISAPIMIIKNWETIKTFFIDLWGGIIGIFTGAWNKMNEIIDNIKNMFTNLISGIKEHPLLSWMFGGDKDINVEGGKMEIDVNVKAEKGTSATIGGIKGKGGKVKARADSTLGYTTSRYGMEMR